jgi:hypothetical protein
MLGETPIVIVQSPQGTLPVILKSPNFELRNRARISKSYKRHTTSLACIPGGRGQTVFSVGFLE